MRTEVHANTSNRRGTWSRSNQYSATIHATAARYLRVSTSPGSRAKNPLGAKLLIASEAMMIKPSRNACSVYRGSGTERAANWSTRISPTRATTPSPALTLTPATELWNGYSAPSASASTDLPHPRVAPRTAGISSVTTCPQATVTTRLPPRPVRAAPVAARSGKSCPGVRAATARHAPAAKRRCSSTPRCPARRQYRPG